MKKIIVGVTGASGTIYAINLLEKLHRLDNVEVHLVMSQWAKKNLELETDYSLSQINALADKVYHSNDQGAAIASGPRAQWKKTLKRKYNCDVCGIAIPRES